MKSVIFDLDGTLIDSAPDIHAAINRMLVAIDYEPLDLPTVISFIGNGLPTLVERVMRHHGIDMSRHDALTQHALVEYSAATSDLTTLYDGVLETLDWIKDNGFQLGLCTNKPYEPTKTALRDFAIDGYFDAVIGGDSLPQRKPDPAPLRSVIESLNATQVLYVGDSEVDFATAQNAQVPFAFFTQGYRNNPDSYFTNCDHFGHFADLKDIVTKVLG